MDSQKKNTAQKPPVPRLSELEWDILKPLWTHGPMAARDIYAHVAAERDWAYKTVKTMLARLVKKGAVAYDQIGNSYLYRAVYTRGEMTQAATSSFIERVFDGALRPFVTNFAAHASEEELAVIRMELARIEKKTKSEKKER